MLSNIFILLLMMNITSIVGRYQAIILIIGLLIFAYRGNALTAPPVIAPTNRYINISSVVFNTADSFGTGLAKLQPLTYTHTFPYVKSGTDYHVGASVAQITYTLPNNRLLNYSIDVDVKTTSKVLFLIFTNNPKSISVFVMYVLIIQTGFMDLYFNYFYHKIGSSLSTGQSITQTWPWAVDPPSLVSSSTVFSSIIGVDITELSSLQVGLSAKVTLISSTDIKIVIKSLSVSTFTLNAIYVMAFVFDNSKLLLVSPAARYNWGTFTDTAGNNASLFVADTKNIIRSYNTMIGITAFWLKGSIFNYNCIINPSVSVAASSSSVWYTFAFNYIVFQFYYCPDNTPYLMVATNTCYDICPMRYCSNDNFFKCTACSKVDCYFCAINGTCTTCNSTLDFRYLNTTTMRCLPLPGYYESNVSAASPCVAANCLTCTSPTVCISCYVGKYLTASKTCAVCIANCYNCTAAASCIQCDVNYVYSSSACVPNCSNVTNCNTCTANSTLVTCLTCQTGYSLINNTCIQVCGDGMVMTPQLCDDNNTVPGDGCSATCTIETSFFCNNTVVPSACAPCVADCDNCTNSTACTLCSTGYISAINGTCTADCSVIANCSTCSYNVSVPATTCFSCQLGYTVQSNICASQCGDGVRVSSQGCDDGGTNSTDGCSSNCTVEIGYFCVDIYPNASICGKCFDFCSVCNDNVICTTCIIGYANNGSACTIDCSPITNCTACDYNGTTQCTVCTLGYDLSSNNTCNTRCGDGIRVNPQGCDDGGTNSTDGCSSNCTIQTGYFCTETYPNASVCGKCIDFCSVCTNNSTCTTCNTGYAYNLTACTIDCSPITNCSACGYNGTTQCANCTLGYHLSSNACIIKCGDGVKISPQGCDDGLLADGDGCSSNCTIETGFFCVDTYPNASICGKCFDFCSVCSGNATCTTCNIGYANNGSACTIDCSPISNCTLCNYNGTTQCTNCSLGYHIDSSSNTCTTQCGDGYRNGNETCDDNNTASNDGCSATCTLQAGFYCSDISIVGGIQSNCQRCMPFCSNCINGTACDLCNTFYEYSPSNISCDINCSSITYCSACNSSGFLNCMGCLIGYYVSSNNSCVNKCGDGIVVTEQSCDDGNNNDGDGCSSVCVLQSSYFCTNTTVNSSLMTVCTKCLLNCFNCTGSVNDCLLCLSGYLYNLGTNVTCDADCGVFLDCATCIPSQCLTCNPGYSLNSNNNCTPTCGDGIVLVGELCDDNNKVNNDGCSSTCQVQTNFECNTINRTSVCSLLSTSIDFLSLFKVPDANSFSIQYQISPSSFPAFSALNWSSIVYQQSNLSIHFTTFNFDSSTGQLSINADYAQNLNYELLQIGLNFPLTAPFNLINATNTSTVLTSDNNLSLEVYSSDTYANSKLLEYLAMGSSLLALLLFILGYFSGKLIGLECVTVFQLTFLSLLTIEDLSPSFSALSKLSYSCGYNIKNMQSSNVKIGRRFNPVNLSEPFLSNYNATMVLFLLPLILSLVLYIINRCKYDSKHQKLTKYSQLFRGEYTFYGLMFSAYQIILSLGIEVNNIGSGMIGAAIGAFLTIFIILYGVLLHKRPQIFGEFTQKFEQQSIIQSHYYCFLIVERIVTAGSLLMITMNPQAAVVLLLLLVQIVVVLLKKPYKGQRAWLRPFMNLLISALILLIFLMNPMLGKSMPQYTAYAPFIIILILIITLVYNLYFFIKNIRGTTEQALQGEQPKQNEEGDLMKQEFKKLNLFQQRMVNPMLDRSNSPDPLMQPQSPSKLSEVLHSSVRQRLNEIKLQSAQISKVQMDNDISFGEVGQI